MQWFDGDLRPDDISWGASQASKVEMAGARLALSLERRRGRIKQFADRQKARADSSTRYSTAFAPIG